MHTGCFLTQKLHMTIKFHVDSFYVEFQADFLTRLTYFFLYVSSLQAMKRPE